MEPATATPTFNLGPEHTPLMAAVLGLGDWICRQRECTPRFERAVRQTQAALRALPIVSPVKDAEYVAIVTPRDRPGDPVGPRRVWGVHLSTDAYGTAALDVFSLYYSGRRDIDTTIDDASHEFEFHLCAGHPGREVSWPAVTRWIREVERLDAARAQPRFGVELDAKYRVLRPPRHSAKPLPPRPLRAVDFC